MDKVGEMGWLIPYFTANLRKKHGLFAFYVVKHVEEWGRISFECHFFVTLLGN